MTKQAAISNNRTDAKARKRPVKVGTKTTSSPVVIAKTKKTTTTSSVSVAKGGKKKHASPRPLPKGWPVSSHLTYPAPSCHGVRATNGSSISDLISDSPSSYKNYLTPGNLLRQSCNGSDVYLRKRAVQSMSAMYPIATAAASGDNNKGGPTRFLIIFPGRMSLKAPPRSSDNNTATRRTSKDDDNDDDDESSEQQGEQTKRESQIDKTDTKKNPFAPTHPPQLLGKLVVTTTALANGGQCSTELRIPLPSSSSDSMHNDQHQQQQQQQQMMMVMSGRAIPLSGKYMALTFKRTGGSKDSAPSGGGGGGGAGGKNKKRGTGSIICKDVFRSVIVLGDSRIVEGDEGVTQIPSRKDEEGEPLEMLHYGGSDRTLDGGGKCNDGIHGGRKSVNGGVPTVTTSVPRKDSISSKESDDMYSDASNVMDVEEDNGDSSDTDEFLPISARKRKSTGGCKKRGAPGDASSDKDDEDVTPARKRTPRRSTEASKISYVDKSSDEEELDSNDSDEGDDDRDDAYNPSRSKLSEKPAVKRSASTTPMAKTNKASNSTAKAGSKLKKSTPVLCVDSSEEENDTEKQIIQSGMRQLKKLTANNGGSSKTVRRPGSGVAKKVNFSPPKNDIIINVDSDEDETEKDELNAIAFDARKRLSTLSTNQSPLKLSPISRGRRKDKKSPTKSPTTTKDNDLSLDDDPFSFL